MVKKYSFEDYKKSEKKLLWQDFFANILAIISGFLCAVLVFCACRCFLVAAIARPILFLYLVIVIIIGAIIYWSWRNAKAREKRRRNSIRDAMNYQADIIDWEDRLDKLNAINTSEFDEIQMKAHSNEIDFATQQILYYTERRDEQMSEYCKHGGKRYI